MKSIKQAFEASNSLTPKEVFKHLLGHVPGMTFVTRRKTIADDRQGIDYVVHRQGRRPLFVDLKEVTYFPSGNDRVLLETAMRGKRVTDGWAVDPKKKTDLVLIVRADGSHVLLSSRRVREALIRHRATWEKNKASKGSISSPGFYEEFYSDFVLVDRKELEAACDEIAEDWKN